MKRRPNLCLAQHSEMNWLCLRLDKECCSAGFPFTGPVLCSWTCPANANPSAVHNKVMLRTGLITHFISRCARLVAGGNKKTWTLNIWLPNLSRGQAHSSKLLFPPLKFTLAVWPDGVEVAELPGLDLSFGSGSSLPTDGLFTHFWTSVAHCFMVCWH